MRLLETTIAHLSDVHLAPLAGFWPHHWNAKRMLGFANWAMRRRKSHLRAVVDMLVADLRHQFCDHILVSGDLVNIGLPQEYENALSWLHALGTPEHVSVVPGNHDIYTRLRRHAGVGRWAPYMVSDTWGAAIAPGKAPHFPYVRRVGDVAIVGLNSAVPTPPGVASGEVGSEQLEACRKVLHELGKMPVFRLVMIHHPPVLDLPQLHPGRDLKDAAALEAVLLETGAELVVHGHNHRDMVNWRETATGPVPVVGIASGSIGRVHRFEPLARYNLYKISGSKAAGWHVELTGRGIREPEGPVVQVERRFLLPEPAAARQVG
jgi:3',5'-cyclic AMP phosphodiesterase CpdA